MHARVVAHRTRLIGERRRFKEAILLRDLTFLSPTNLADNMAKINHHSLELFTSSMPSPIQRITGTAIELPKALYRRESGA